MAKQSNTIYDIPIPEGDVNLPSWLVDPDSNQAAADCERDVTAWFIQNRMAELGMTHKEAEELAEPERLRLIAEGVHQAIRNMGGGEEVMGRALQSLAFKAFKANLHAYDQHEPETFEEFLLERLGHVKSAGAISETKFMLELLEMYEKRGKRKFVENLFQSRKNFAKFCKAIRVIRARRDELYSGEKHMKEAMTRLDLEIENAQGADKEKLLSQRKQIEETHKKVQEVLEENLSKTLEKSVELSQDPNVDPDGPNGIVKTLSRISQDNPAGQIQKLCVPKLLLPHSVVYIITCSNGYEQIIDRAISDFAETHVTDPMVAFAPYKKYIDGKEKK